MDNADMNARYPLTATATFELVTTRTLIEALSLLGIDWSPIPFDQMVPSSVKGLYTWVIGRGHEHVDLFDLPVAYVGIGIRKNGGVRGRLLSERSLVKDSAGHAHGRAMFRLLGSPLGGPVQQITGADISPIEETIRASEWKNKERGIQKLRTWLSAPTPDVVDKAEELCIRAAVHIGDTPPPLNGHHAGAWGIDAPCDWGGWAVAQRLANCHVSVEIEHPDIRYVVYPVHLDGTLTGEPPRMRHDPDCGHFEWRDGRTLGDPKLATDEQMRTLRACKSCVERRSDSSATDTPATREGKLGQLCPSCHQVMPLVGICDNCG